ncbi:hypothetical protein [Nocardia sp. NPDC052112]|uniref:hypothetical protein n=1 Tax=Nocardia sp. NPDC052112 TaxID=3155646 RepID=UPI003428093D
MPSRHDRRRQADRIPAARAEIQALFRVAAGYHRGVLSFIEECALHSTRRPAR